MALYLRIQRCGYDPQSPGGTDLTVLESKREETCGFSTEQKTPWGEVAKILKSPVPILKMS